MAAEDKDEMVVEEGTEVESDQNEEIENNSDEAGGEEEVKILQPWEEQPEVDKPISVNAQIKQRRKFQKREETIKLENDKLKTELEQLKKSGTKTENTLPREEDFDTWEEFKEAEAKHTQNFIKSQMQTERQQEEFKRNQIATEKEVGNHYGRVEKFIKTSGVKQEVYDNSDEVARGILEEVFPGQGDFQFERLISKMGEGSAEVAYYIGRNKAEFQSVLMNDKTGIEAAIFLGRKLEQFKGSAKKRQSKAPAPASTADGDTAVTGGSVGEKALKKQYEAAHKEGNGSKALDIKMNARRVHKIDTSKW